MIIKRTLITLLAGILAIQPALLHRSSTRLTTEATGMLAPTSPFATPVMQQIKGVVLRQMRLYQEEARRQEQRQKEFAEKAKQFYLDFQNLETIWKYSLRQFKKSHASPEIFVPELERTLKSHKAIDDPTLRIEQTYSKDHFAIICAGGFRIPFCIEEGRIFRTNLPYTSTRERMAFYITRHSIIILQWIWKLFVSQLLVLLISGMLYLITTILNIESASLATLLGWAMSISGTICGMIILPFLSPETGTWLLSFRKNTDHGLLLKFIERNRIRRPLYDDQDPSASSSISDMEFTQTLLRYENLVFEDVNTRECLLAIRAIAKEVERAFREKRGYLPKEIQNKDPLQKEQDLQLLAKLFARSSKLTINSSSRAKRKVATLASIVEERIGVCLETVYLFLAVSECLHLPVFPLQNGISHISCLWDDAKDQYVIETTLLGKRTPSGGYDDSAAQSIHTVEKPFLYSDRELFIEEYSLGGYTALYSKKQFLNSVAFYYFTRSFNRLSMTDERRKAIFFDEIGIDRLSSADFEQILPLIDHYDKNPFCYIPIELILGQVINFINCFYAFPATHFLVARLLQEANNAAWLEHKNRAATTTGSPLLLMHMGMHCNDSALLEKGRMFKVDKTAYTLNAGKAYLTCVEDYEKAAKAFLWYYKKDPSNYTINNYLITALAFLKESQQAQEIIENWERISNASDQGRFFRHAGLIYLMEGEFEQAVTHLEGYLKHAGGEYDIHLHLLVCRLLMKDTKGFAKELELFYRKWSCSDSTYALNRNTLGKIIPMCEQLELFTYDPSGISRQFLEIIIGQLKAENLEQLEQRIIKLQKRVQHKPYLLKATKLLLLAQQPVTETPYNLPTKASPRLDTLTQQPGMETLEQAA